MDDNYDKQCERIAENLLTDIAKAMQSASESWFKYELDESVLVRSLTAKRLRKLGFLVNEFGYPDQIQTLYIAVPS